MRHGSRLLVVGLDCAEPSLVFERWRGDLPNLRRLMDQGVYGELESTVPPITVPAWMCMLTAHDPGSLGIYGFRNRRNRSYDALAFANSTMVKKPAVWDIAGEAGLKTVALGVPLTYPPKAINGWMVSGFLAPGTDCEYTYPSELKGEIASVVGEYVLDVRDYRTDRRAELLRRVYEMTEKRFELARHLIRSRDWDLFVMVEMGPDRLHHAFWRYIDPLHVKHEKNTEFSEAVLGYYRYLDQQIGALMGLAPDAAVMVVSDHGARRMDGGICLNEWLVQEGYLSLRNKPEGIKRLDVGMVDWDRTVAWGDGGYYGRLFLNVRGREPRGVIYPKDYEKVRTELAAKLEALPDENGRPLGTVVFRPEEVYAACRNVPPDLIIYFGNLGWRSVGSVGHGSVWTRENDTGPDDANHAQHGIFVLSAPGWSGARRLARLRTYDVARTMLAVMGVEAPPGMPGSVIAK
ncbi:MAG: alkaline phosphatase family protein [Armatimonadota bacterium]